MHQREASEWVLGEAVQAQDERETDAAPAGTEITTAFGASQVEHHDIPDVQTMARRRCTYKDEWEVDVALDRSSTSPAHSARATPSASPVAQKEIDLL